MRRSPDDMPTLRDLDELVALSARAPGLYLRWSRGPAADAEKTSRDELTGVRLPGLSANPLAVESWWAERSPRLWVARRLYDYRHLRDVRGPGVRPWVLRGREVARGPDNEPLVTCDEPVAWVDLDVVGEATRLVDAQAASWGPLDRR